MALARASRTDAGAAETATGRTRDVQAPLMPAGALGEQPWAIPFDWLECAELVDWARRQVRSDEPAHTADERPRILKPMGGRRYMPTSI